MLNLRTLLTSISVVAALNAGAQTYRESFPLPDASTFSGLGVNVNTALTATKAQMIADAGFRFVRADLGWDDVERTTKGVYSWSSPDAFIAAAKAKGLRVMFIMAYGNRLYSQTGAPNTPEAREGFARFAAAAVARYKGQGIVWELYNEPNLEQWWPQPNPVDYAAFVNTVAPAMRAAGPEEWITGLSTEIYRSGNKTYIDTVLAGGVLNHFDAVAQHAYNSSNPESSEPNWNLIASNVAAVSPVGKSIGLISGETGYSRNWTGITEAQQATYLIRQVLYGMSRGIGLNIVFNFENLGADPKDWHNTMGLTSHGTNVPYPAYYAFQRMGDQLGNYRLAKRLTLSSANDYCLLFVNKTDATDCKLAVWTTVGAHTVTVPSSVATFDSTVVTTGAAGTAVASSNGLALTLNDEATVYDCRGANPLLSLAGRWDKIPATVTLANRADAVAKLGSVVCSPAWADAPAGSKLVVSDVPAPMIGYVRPSLNMTLTDLSTLNMNSASVQTLFNSLGALQDSLDAGRTLTFSLILPDGSSAAQTCGVLRKNPMRVFNTTPQSGNLTLRVENPSTSAFRGTVTASSGLLSQTMPISFQAGETAKQVFFTAMPTLLLGTKVSYALFDTTGASVLVPTDPTIQSGSVAVTRFPDLVPVTGYRVEIKGDAAVEGSATMSYGLSNWGTLFGASIAHVDYTFGKGGKYFRIVPPTPLYNTLYSTAPVSLGMWIYGDGSANGLSAQFVDATGQTFHASGGEIDWIGWKWVSIPLTGKWATSWGGANDGQIHYPIRCTVPVLFDSNRVGTSGRVSFFGITLTRLQP